MHAPGSHLGTGSCPECSTSHIDTDYKGGRQDLTDVYKRGIHGLIIRQAEKKEEGKNETLIRCRHRQTQDGVQRWSQ